MITFFILHLMGRSIDSMVLSGLALAFSRLIDDSVVVIENIYRHIELGEDPKVAAIHGANEVALPVLAIMLVAVVVFFPVTFLFGVARSFLCTGAGRRSGSIRFLFRRHDGGPLFCPSFSSRSIRAGKKQKKSREPGE